METEDVPVIRRDTRATGFVLGTCLHLVGLPLVALFRLEFLTGRLGGDYFTRLLMVACLFGWTQLPYMVPAAIVLHVRGQGPARDGLLISVGIGFLITSGCCGMILIAQP